MRVAPNNASIIGYAIRGESARTGNGNMSTDSFRVGFPRRAPYYGQLPKAWQGILEDGFGNGRVSQVIYSYSTPIAWHDSQYGWVVPYVRYSATTSTKHQPLLWKLAQRRIVLPWDASDEEARRVMDGKMYYGTNMRGEITRSYPGRNYVKGE